MIGKRVASFLIVACVSFLFASFTVSSFLVPVKAAANVVIVSHMSYRDFLNYYHVVGEVQNTGDTPVNDVYISIVLYDNLGGVVDSIDTEILLDVLLVGRKAPFMYVASEENSAKINTYTVNLKSFETSSEKPMGLEILSHTSTVTGFPVRVIMVTGQVRNNGILMAIAVKIVVTFYSGPGGSGSVVGASLGVSTPVSLNPNEIGTFATVPQDVTNRELSFVSYLLTAESLEYSGNVVPEFPAPIISIIFMATTLVAVAMMRRK